MMIIFIIITCFYFPKALLFTEWEGWSPVKMENIALFIPA
jgi:hypothetical protein